MSSNTVICNILYIHTNHIHIFIFIYTVHFHKIQSTWLNSLVGRGWLDGTPYANYVTLSLLPDLKAKNDRVFHSCINKNFESMHIFCLVLHFHSQSNKIYKNKWSIQIKWSIIYNFFFASYLLEKKYLWRQTYLWLSFREIWNEV